MGLAASTARRQTRRDCGGPHDHRETGREATREERAPARPGPVPPRTSPPRVRTRWSAPAPRPLPHRLRPLGHRAPPADPVGRAGRDHRADAAGHPDRDEPVSVSAGAFRRHLFVAADAARLSDPGNTADLLAERVLQHVYALDAADRPGGRGHGRAAPRRGSRIRHGPGVRLPDLGDDGPLPAGGRTDQGPVAATLQRATTEVVALTASRLTAGRHRHPRRERPGHDRRHRVAPAGLPDVHPDGGPAGQRRAWPTATPRFASARDTAVEERHRRLDLRHQRRPASRTPPDAEGQRGRAGAGRAARPDRRPEHHRWRHRRYAGRPGRRTPSAPPLPISDDALRQPGRRPRPAPARTRWTPPSRSRPSRTPARARRRWPCRAAS